MYVFVAAAPRSGTTFLGDFLSGHSEICAWHEPYFIWQYMLKDIPDDYLDENNVTSDVMNFVRSEFEWYLKKSGKKILVEKTPVNALKVKYMNCIFPEAKWIHLYRDGRSVISSMKERYDYRIDIIKNRKYSKLLKDIIYTLKRQPYLRHKLMAIWYELKHRRHINPYIEGCRPGGDLEIIFGPKYRGWEEDRASLPLIQFMAKQWIECELYIGLALKDVPAENVLHVKYEDLANNSVLEIEKICAHIGVDKQELLAKKHEIIKVDSEKWKQNLTENDMKLISPIINDLLIELGYKSD